jgi:hypothetical protein
LTNYGISVHSDAGHCPSEDLRKDAAEAGLSEDELKDIESAIAADPELGEVMQGTGGCRKARFAKKGQWEI